VPSVTIATWGGGFDSATSGTTTGAAVTTPVATAPVAVAGVAAFTG
jgi:hypothetical protein